MMAGAVKVPLDPGVDQILGGLLAPGQRARLSPFVESAQLHLLTGQWPAERGRSDSIHTIVRQNQAQIEALAGAWQHTRNQFSAENYQTSAYLQMYALYYFSVNVSKLQALLYDLVREGQLAGELCVLDIGVGAGSTAVALLDFLYAWGLACELCQKPFPVTGFRYVGMDRSQPALDLSRQMVENLSEALRQRAQEHDLPSGLLAKLSDWSQQVSWKWHDLERQPPAVPNDANLVVLSNALNELARDAVEHFETCLNSLVPGALVVVIEPGDTLKTRTLMKWRAKFQAANPAFVSVAPCLPEAAPSPDCACSTCWAARRAAFHQTPLYLAFRSACLKHSGDERSFEEYENNLLSWSYVILRKGERAAGPPRQPAGPALEAGRVLTTPMRLRFVGKFIKPEPGQKHFQAADTSIDNDPVRGKPRTWNEYYKLCPGVFPGAKSVALERSPGFQIPLLAFGQEFMAANLGVAPFENTPGCYRLVPQGDGQTAIEPLAPPALLPGGLNSLFLIYHGATRPCLDELAHRIFGFTGLRDFQHELLSRVLTGRSVLGIAATGGGKSECYILPAMLLPGITVVISPLRSLMMDQLEQRIQQRYGLGDLATSINGDVPVMERQARLKRMELGYYKLVYFTPEQLERGYILDSLRRANAAVGIRYLAMDEAHCISQWGHDFRSSYLNIVRRLREYEINPTIIALTATASPNVRRDICDELGLNPLPVDQGGDVFVYSSNRPEINLEVRVKHTTGEKVGDILNELRRFQQYNHNNQAPGAALVFMPHTGGSPEQTWRYLPQKNSSRRGRNSAGVVGFASYLERQLSQRVAIYHSKMDSEHDETGEQPGAENPRKLLGDLSGRTRAEEQSLFINSISSGVDIMVATKGFGMGIDKPNIRLVIHRTPTANMEAYAQESGRAGRDGDQATAILYYSPDSTSDDDGEPGENGSEARRQAVKSDYEIQEEFLNGRYIRREDVMAVRAFLMQEQRRLELPAEAGRPERTYLYFTNDEVMAFFDRCRENPALAGLSAPFEWPKFPRREPSASYESEEHKRILDRGHSYESRTRYIDRILATLFRIRPELGGKPNQAFLESVLDTDAQVVVDDRWFRCDWSKIYHSNAYFGAILRQRQVTEAEFLAALHASDLLPFAARLHLTLRELTGLLSDIRMAEGNFNNGHWKPALLDYSGTRVPAYGPAAEKSSLEEWRAYAGAWRRSPTVKQNALKSRHEKPTSDDYFTWKDVCKSRGWEVLPGPAFETQFPAFLEAFMQLHDERQQNDWASYHRLLTDYIGVSADGAIPIQAGAHECLRSVLLGYLESYEVVVDGKCYSCSQCVPDGRYDRYSAEQRLHAVTRMQPGLVALFKEFKEYQRELPEPERVAYFFKQLAAEEAQGRALYRYFMGWSGKLLDDAPDHLAAKWLRLEAMARRVILLQPQELYTLTQQILDRLPAGRLPEVEALLAGVAGELANEPDCAYLSAVVARRLEKVPQEAAFLADAVERELQQAKPNRERLYSGTARLSELTHPYGELPDRQHFGEWATWAARSTDDYERSLRWYEELTPNWGWEAVAAELNFQADFAGKPQNEAALLASWLTEGRPQPEIELFLEWLAPQLEKLLTWPPAARPAALKLCPDEFILRSAGLVESALSGEIEETRMLPIGIKAIEAGLPLRAEIHKRLAGLLSGQAEPPAQVIARHLAAPDHLARVAATLASSAPIQTWDELQTWLPVSGAEMPAGIIPVAIPLAANAGDAVQIMVGLQDQVLKMGLDDEPVRSLFLQHWLPIYLRTPPLLERLLQFVNQPGAPAGVFTQALQAASDQILDDLLKKGEIEILGSLPR